MSARNSVTVSIRGREFRVLTDQDDASLQRVARMLDETMAHVSERTATVDSLDVALLTALNLAREVLELRGELATPPDADPIRLRSLIERAESALSPH